MSKRSSVILGIVGAMFLAAVGLTLWKQAQPKEEVVESVYTYAVIKEMAEGIDMSEYDVDSITDRDGIWDNVEGDAKAPVVIYEYADFQCSHCAEINPYINKLVAEYEGKVAVVLRTYLLNYGVNGTLAAKAVNAAAKQGYFQEMKDQLFESQAEWYYLREEKFREKLGEYFMTVSEDRGDREEFYEEMESEEVVRKLAFDMAAGMKEGLMGTPWFIINGEWLENTGVSATRYVSQMREKINEELKKLGEQ